MVGSICQWFEEIYFPILIFTVKLKGGLYHNCVSFLFLLFLLGFSVGLYISTYSHMHCLIVSLGMVVWWR